MDGLNALLAGLVAGIAIATQVGAVSLLLVDTALVVRPRTAVAAGMGVATADLGFAVVAVAAGGAAGAVLADHETAIKVVAAAFLAAIAIHGLATLPRSTSDDGAPGVHAADSPRAQYLRLLGITAVNPLTIASFAAIAATLSLHGLAPYVAFVVGVGLASAGWHAFLTLTAAHAGRWITPRMHRALGIAGRVLILALAARLALS